jgi:hypothetical protein
MFHACFPLAVIVSIILRIASAYHAEHAWDPVQQRAPTRNSNGLPLRMEGRINAIKKSNNAGGAEGGTLESRP